MFGHWAYNCSSWKGSQLLFQLPDYMIFILFQWLGCMSCKLFLAFAFANCSKHKCLCIFLAIHSSFPILNCSFPLSEQPFPPGALLWAFQFKTCGLSQSLQSFPPSFSRFASDFISRTIFGQFSECSLALYKWDWQVLPEDLNFRLSKTLFRSWGPWFPRCGCLIWFEVFIKICSEGCSVVQFDCSWSWVYWAAIWGLVKDGITLSGFSFCSFLVCSLLTSFGKDWSRHNNPLLPDCVLVIRLSF